MKTIKPQSLTAAAFKPFGQVLSLACGKPMARNTELTYWGKVAQFGMGAKLSTGVLLGHKRSPVVTQLERHVHTPEVLVATEGESVICFGAPSGKGNITKIKAFRIREGDAFCMHTGTWHWVAFPKAKQCKFLVLFAAGTEARDLQIRPLNESLRIVGA